MEATFTVQLKPFTVPDYVLVEPPIGKRQDGFVEGPTYRLEELDTMTLEALCDEFRDAVFLKAQKSRPPQPH